MGTYLANLRNEDRWLKIQDHVINNDYSQIDLDEAMSYDENNNIADQLFKINNFSRTVNLDLYSYPLNVADLHNLEYAQYPFMKLIAFYDNGKFYLQKVTRGAYIRRKFFHGVEKTYRLTKVTI